MIDRSIFFAETRRRLARRGWTQSQVDGLTILLDEWERREVSDLRWLAYALATAFHETAFTFQPVREIGLGKGRAYGRRDPRTGQAYYGRGFVQLTWKRNYLALGQRCGVDLVVEPDRALEPQLAARILFDGMIHGLFTGQKFAHFFDASTSDWEGARRIVNGEDRADRIAAYARQFHAALLAAARVDASSSGFASGLWRRLRALWPA